MGAFQNRFESTIVSLQTTNENLTASRGRIKDADFAKETSNLSRSQVLQQAGTAMLAQANQSAQGVLSLLR
jgi:flagellin